MKLSKVKIQQNEIKIFSWKSIHDLGESNDWVVPIPPSSGDIAILMYTSGSSGKPKVR